MKRFAASLFVSAFAVSSAFGGTVSFTEMASDANSTTFAVAIDATDMANFDGVDLIMGTVTTGIGLSAVHDAGFVATTTVAPPAPAAFGIYPSVGGSDMWLSGFNGRGDWSAPLLVGEVTVTHGGVPGVLQVDAGWELANVGAGLSGVVLAGTPESVVGSVPFPEPATLMLLGLGGLAVLRRRAA